MAFSNPEFIRYARADLRPARILSAGFLTLVISFLVGLSCWGVFRENRREFFSTFYAWLTGIQFLVLGLWSASTCAQSVSRERELKTYDFVRTTRLTARELLAGKLLGAPIIGYFAVACSLPIAFVAGLLGDISISALFRTLILLVAFALFLGVIGLWVSMMVERTSAIAVALLFFISLGWGMQFLAGPTPGLAGISVLLSVLSVHEVSWGRGPNALDLTAPFFGQDVSYFYLTLILYGSLGAWVALMIARNIKKDLDQIRLLSRWQAIAFALFLNVLVYAFTDAQRVSLQRGRQFISPQAFTQLLVGMNAAILFMIGLFTLTPHEKLKMWWRRRQAGTASHLDADGLPWPWLLLAAVVGYALLFAVTPLLRSDLSFDAWGLPVAAVQLLSVLLFVTRDVLFLQWCVLTRSRRPIMMGVLYVALYYIAASIIAAVAGIGAGSLRATLFGLLTPFPFEMTIRLPAVYIGMLLQLGIIIWITTAIMRRLSRPAVAAAVAA